MWRAIFGLFSERRQRVYCTAGGVSLGVGRDDGAQNAGDHLRHYGIAESFNPLPAHVLTSG